MTGTIFEQGQTFADEIEYKREVADDNDLVEEEAEEKESFDDISVSMDLADTQERIIANAMKELNPDLSREPVLTACGQSEDLDDLMTALLKTAAEANGKVESLMASVAVLGEAVEELQARLNALVKKLDNIDADDDDGEVFYEPDDEEEVVIPTKKKHQPGRPVKQEPKIKVVKKKKAKALVKKAVQRKPKSVKKKTKR